MGRFCVSAFRVNNGVEYSVDDDGIDYDPTTGRVEEAMDMLLKYTPANQQRRAFLLSNADGRNLLHLACSRGYLRLVEYLIERGEDIPGMKISKALDAKDKFGYTPFLAAVAADACV